MVTKIYNLSTTTLASKRSKKSSRSSGQRPQAARFQSLTNQSIFPYNALVYQHELNPQVKPLKSKHKLHPRHPAEESKTQLRLKSARRVDAHRGVGLERVLLLEVRAEGGDVVVLVAVGARELGPHLLVHVQLLHPRPICTHQTKARATRSEKQTPKHEAEVPGVGEARVAAPLWPSCAA